MQKELAAALELCTLQARAIKETIRCANAILRSPFKVEPQAKTPRVMILGVGNQKEQGKEPHRRQQS